MLFYGVISVEYKKEQFNEKVLTDHITKEQWIDILKNSNLIGLRDMKILLNLYGSNGQPLKTSLIGEHLEFEDISTRIQKMCKKIEEELGITLDEKSEMGSWKYKFRHWFIMLNGSKIYDEKEEKNYFTWTLKKELKEAIDSLLGKE
ncbi:hypothetical protein CPR_0104 [Clostridium perfringens SM101]|uniref:Uncharacterized protein n=1 Tax=Clostridium perfringens (strain SM101 / Type A) TaxID=289380 RepID=Q0SWQ9_CLOPS|nr:hypothetical protein [Clostridium perfringens]ABG86010.1 hypothetical protein CPR_0104 [Clostridium perfringens SM101]